MFVLVLFRVLLLSCLFFVCGKVLCLLRVRVLGGLYCLVLFFALNRMFVCLCCVVYVLLVCIDCLIAFGC